MAYKHPSDEIAQYLINEGTVNNGEIFVDMHPDMSEVNADVITIVRMVGGIPNPRWTRDDINIVIQTMGSRKQDLVATRDLLWSVYNKLLGAYNIELNGYTYFRFISNQMPNFVTFLENGEPIYTSSLSFVREAQAAEGNRETIS